MEAPDPRHLGLLPSRPAQHLHYPVAVPATRGRSCSMHAGPTAAQKTVLQRATARKTFPRRPKETLQRHSKNISESVRHHSSRLEANRPVPGLNDAPPFAKAPRRLRPTGQPQQRARGQGRKGGASDPPSDDPIIPCPHGQRSFRARTGLVSYDLPTLRQIQPPQTPRFF